MAKRYIRRTMLTGVGCAAMLASATPAFSQDADADTQAAASDARADQDRVEDIVVTAQRRESRLQETPISISAFSQRALEQRGINNLQNLTNFAPNVEISTTKRPAGGGTSIAAFIRGVGTGDYQIPTDPAIGLYVDGVYIARTTGGLLSIADIERVEVLKGPQGTLFGRNTLGGAISVITTQPRLNGPAEGKIELRFGDYGRADAVASINGALIPDVLGAKFSISTLNFDGWQYNPLNRERYGKEGRIVGRGSLLFQASPTFDMQLTGDYTRQRQNSINGQLLRVETTATAPRRFNEFAAPVLAPGLGLPANSGLGPQWISGSPRITYETAPNNDDSDIWGLSLVGRLDLGGARLKSTTAYRNLDATIQVAGDGTPFPTNQALSFLSSKQFSQEFELGGQLFGDRVDYILGAYYFHEDATADRFGKNFEGVYAVTGLLSDARSQNESYTMTAESIAGFGQFTVDLGAGLELLAGARINRDFKRYSAQLVRAETNTITVPRTFAEESWTSFTPRLGINYKASDDLFLFASYARGFKSGGFGTPFPGGSGIPSYGPEELTTYEAGIKSGLFDNKLTLNFAAFYSDYQGVQITTLIQPNSFRTIQNGGDAEIYGFDFDLDAAPLPGLRVNASLGYNHARFTSVTPEAVAASATNGLAHRPGTPLPYIPDWSASIGAQYSAEIDGFGTLTPRLDYTFKSKAVLTLADPSTTQFDYALLNAKLTFVPASNPDIEVSLNMNNVTNRTYYYFRIYAASAGNESAAAGDPRLVYAQVRFKF